MIAKKNDPDFNESFEFDINIGERTYSTLKVQFVVKAEGMVTNDTIGYCSLNLKDYIDQSGRWF